MYIAIIGVGVAYLLASVALFYHYVVRIHKARTWLAHGAVLLDVDTTAEFTKHHPRRAISIPLEYLERRARRTADKTRPVVIFAHSWLRGAKAVFTLRGNGFSRVLNAAGLYTREKISDGAPPLAPTMTTVKTEDLVELTRAPRSERAKENLAPPGTRS